METEGTTAATLDRRQRRRLETIEEVLDVALEIMAEQGAAGLSLGEVARRIGIRPPSLYVYFESKNALYDALFERGARELRDLMNDVYRDIHGNATVEQSLLATANAMIRWRVEHQAYSQLLFWRPVPGFAPSEAAYAPAVQMYAEGLERFADLQRRGQLRADVPTADVMRDWTVIVTGTASQQLSNAPDEPFETGRFTAALPGLVAMFVRHYAPLSAPAPRRRARHADQR